MKLLAFAAASALLAATPGPGVLYVVTRTLAAGRRAGGTSRSTPLINSPLRMILSSSSSSLLPEFLPPLHS